MRSILTNTISSSTIFLLQTFYIKGRNATDGARGHITLLTPLFSLLVHVEDILPFWHHFSLLVHVWVNINLLFTSFLLFMTFEIGVHFRPANVIVLLVLCYVQSKSKRCTLCNGKIFHQTLTKSSKVIVHDRFVCNIDIDIRFIL